MHTSPSIVTVSGFSIVTPASIRSRALRSRRIWSTSASSTRVLMPSSSFAFGTSMRLHLVSGAVQDLDDVGQIIFMRGIVGANLRNVLPQKLGAKTVNTGVNELDGELLRRGCFLLDDLPDLAVVVQNHPAVARGVVQARGNQGCGCCALLPAAGQVPVGLPCESSGQSPYRITTRPLRVEARRGTT